MKRICILVLISLAISVPGVCKTKDQPCRENAKSQLELNQCAGAELKAAEDELGKIYQQIKEQYAADKMFLNQLEAAQKAWVAFRDAELEAVFPNPQKRGEHGSVYPMCFAEWKARLTAERTKQLRRWIDGVEEGNVCAGSQPIRSAPEK